MRRVPALVAVPLAALAGGVLPLAARENALVRIELDGSNDGGVASDLDIRAPSVVRRLAVNRVLVGVCFEDATATGVAGRIPALRGCPAENGPCCPGRRRSLFPRPT